MLAALLLLISVKMELFEDCSFRRLNKTKFLASGHSDPGMGHTSSRLFSGCSFLSASPLHPHRAPRILTSSHAVRTFSVPRCLLGLALLTSSETLLVI